MVFGDSSGAGSSARGLLPCSLIESPLVQFHNAAAGVTAGLRTGAVGILMIQGSEMEFGGLWVGDRVGVEFEDHAALTLALCS